MATNPGAIEAKKRRRATSETSDAAPPLNSRRSAKPAAPRKRAAPAGQALATGDEDVKESKVSKRKAKLVRDSFTMPQDDFELIAKMKSRMIDMKRPVKKSELLRAGLQVLSALDNKALLQSVSRLTQLKAGRPKSAA